MFPTSTPRLISRWPFPHLGQRSPSRTSCASTISPLKSRLFTTSRRCASFLLAPAMYAIPMRASRGLLHVRAVIAVGADGDAILADLGQHLKLMGDVAAHRTGVRLNADRVETHPHERLLVRAELRGVALLESGLIDVEAVGVLHD